MERKLKITLIIAAFCLIGCKGEKNSEPKFWDTTPEQVKKAEIAARQFAREELKVSEEILNRIKYNIYGFYREDKQVIHLEFIDPIFFPDWKNVSGVLGGFPHYFTISVSIENFKIVDHYACSE